MNELLLLAVVFVVLTLMGVPLFVSVGLTTAFALFLIDIPYTLMAQTGYGSLTPFPLLTIPLFVLAGRLMEVGGMVMDGRSEDLLASEDIKEFYLGKKEEGVRGRRRWKKRKTWR